MNKNWFRLCTQIKYENPKRISKKYYVAYLHFLTRLLVPIRRLESDGRFSLFTSFGAAIVETTFIIKRINIDEFMIPPVCFAFLASELYMLKLRLVKNSFFTVFQKKIKKIME